MPPAQVDLTPFGFTGTESAVYGALLRSGPATGYAVAQAVGLARANVYAALSGLVARQAAALLAGRPARYRPVDPQTLVTQLAAQQAGALERLERSLRETSAAPAEVVHEVAGARPLANVVLQLVARAERSVEGVIDGELFRATGPAWRRAAGRATLAVRSAAVDEGGGVLTGPAPADSGTLLVVDGVLAVVGSGTGDAARGIWGDHPLMVSLARRALAGMA
jgi:sugar-specific transcriptional regulator TrmB